MLLAVQSLSRSGYKPYGIVSTPFQAVSLRRQNVQNAAIRTFADDTALKTIKNSLFYEEREFRKPLPIESAPKHRIEKSSALGLVAIGAAAALGLGLISMITEKPEKNDLLDSLRKEWGGNEDNFGFAVLLRPHVGKGNKEIDFAFGRALKNGSHIGSKMYYEGLFWMHQSKGINVRYPEPGQSFDMAEVFYRRECWYQTYHRQDGLVHFHPTLILAPSKESWEKYIKEKLTDIKIAPPQFYKFSYNSEKIKSILNSNNIDFVLSGSSVVSGSDVIGFKTYPITIVSIYKDHKKLGEISVQQDSFMIDKTFVNQEIQPLINFVEQVLMRTGSGNSAMEWLRQIGKL